MTVISLVGPAAASCSAPCVGRDPPEPLSQDGEKITISKKPNSCQFILFHQRTADGEFELIEWRPIIPEGAHILQRGFAIGSLRIKEIEQAGTAPPVCKVGGLSSFLSFREVIIAECGHFLPLGQHCPEGCVNFRKSLRNRSLIGCFYASSFGVGAKDFSLVAIEDSERKADPDPYGVKFSIPPVFKQWR